MALCMQYRPRVLLVEVNSSGKGLVEFVGKHQSATGENIGVVLISKRRLPGCEEMLGIRYVKEPFAWSDLICAIKEAEHVVLLKDERDMFLEQLTEYSTGLEKIVEEQTRELSTANIRLKKLSVTDDLTGIYNRRYFFERLTEEINQARRYGHPLSVMILDLDDFKNVNDCMGHLAGDAVLREVAALLRAKLRKGETVARYGGEEFSIILPHVDREGALRAAEASRIMLQSSVISTTEGNTSVTVSIGVAEMDSEINDPDEVLARADIALYEAKRKGKNRSLSWPPE